MLAHQMTRITKEKGALVHDDRLDVLSMAVSYWVEQMAADADVSIKDRKSELLDIELEKFMEHALYPVGFEHEPKYHNWIN